MCQTFFRRLCRACVAKLDGGLVSRQSGAPGPRNPLAVGLSAATWPSFCTWALTFSLSWFKNSSWSDISAFSCSWKRAVSAMRTACHWEIARISTSESFTKVLLAQVSPWPSVGGFVVSFDLCVSRSCVHVVFAGLWSVLYFSRSSVLFLFHYSAFGFPSFISVICVHRCHLSSCFVLSVCVSLLHLFVFSSYPFLLSISASSLRESHTESFHES